MDGATPMLSPDSTSMRLELLEQEELRALAAGVGEHLPVELALRVEAIRRERLELAAQLRPAG